MMQFDNVQKLSKDGVDAAMKSFDALSKGAQSAAADASEFAKRSYEEGSLAMQKLAAVRTLDNALEIQTEFARASYENLVDHATKLGTAYTAMAREAFAPVGAMMSKPFTKA
jgi:hypothetical protein